MLQNLNTAIITEVQIIKILPKPSKWVAAQILFWKHTQFIFVFTVRTEWFHFPFLSFHLLKLIILRWDTAQGLFFVILLNFD